MAKIKSLIVCLLCSIALVGTACAGTLRDEVQQTYLHEVGVRELTGHNDGKQVEAYLKSVSLKKGEPWCAAFVSWVYQQNHVENPHSGYCPNLFTSHNTIYQSGKVKQNPQKGDVFGIYFRDKRRIAHVGFINKWTDKFVETVEGNTNESGSREGDGVYIKKRLKRQIYTVSCWI